MGAAVRIGLQGLGPRRDHGRTEGAHACATTRPCTSPQQWSSTASSLPPRSAPRRSVRGPTPARHGGLAAHLPVCGFCLVPIVVRLVCQAGDLQLPERVAVASAEPVPRGPSLQRHPCAPAFRPGNSVRGDDRPLKSPLYNATTWGRTSYVTPLDRSKQNPNIWGVQPPARSGGVAGPAAIIGEVLLPRIWGF